jgi:hypothetical protein
MSLPSPLPRKPCCAYLEKPPTVPLFARLPQTA